MTKNWDSEKVIQDMLEGYEEELGIVKERNRRMEDALDDIISMCESIPNNIRAIMDRFRAITHKAVQART